MGAEGTSPSTSASPPLDPIADGANEEAVPSREEPPSLAHDAGIVSDQQAYLYPQSFVSPPPQYL